jgi:hypothetical protein
LNFGMDPFGSGASGSGGAFVAIGLRWLSTPPHSA